MTNERCFILQHKEHARQQPFSKPLVSAMSLATRDAAATLPPDEIASLVQINQLATYLGLVVASMLVYDTGAFSVFFNRHTLL